MMSSDDPQQGWRLAAPAAGLKSLQRSLTSQQALVPQLARVSSTLSEVKANGQAALQKLQVRESSRTRSEIARRLQTHGRALRDASRGRSAPSEQLRRPSVSRGHRRRRAPTPSPLSLQNGLESDLALLRTVGTPAEPRRSPGGMRRVASDTNFSRPTPARHLLQRPPIFAGGAASRGQLTAAQQRQVDAWDWLSVLNTTLNQARAAQQQRFAMSRAGLEEQVRRAGGFWRRWGNSSCPNFLTPPAFFVCTLSSSVLWHITAVIPRCTRPPCVPSPTAPPLQRPNQRPAAYCCQHPTPVFPPASPHVITQAKQLVHSASSMSLQEVKEQLLQRPKAALRDAAATLETCQANLATLHTSLSQSLQTSLAEGRSTLERHLSTVGEPGSPSTSASRLAALISPQRLAGLQGQGGGAADGDDDGSGADLPPWSLMPAPMRGREAAAIEALVTEDEQDGEEEEASTSGRSGWGPFQVRAVGMMLFMVAVRSALRACLCLAAAAAAAAACAHAARRSASKHHTHFACLSPRVRACDCSGTRSSGGAARRAARTAACGRQGDRC